MAFLEQEVFVLSERTLSNVIDQIQVQQWNQTTPDWFQTGRQGKLTLRDIVNSHAYDSAWVPDVLASKTLTEVGSTYDGDLLGNDPKGSYRRYSEQAIAAALELKNPDNVVHLSYGTFLLASISSISRASAASEPMTLPNGSARTRRCSLNWCKGSGTSFSPK